MSALYTILTFIFGLVIGSFVNVLILRQDNLKSIINTRSQCPQCKTKLKWIDLIPVLSYLMLRGKCRYCGKKISIQYPLVELGLGFLFVLLFFNFGINLAFAFYALIFSLLTVVFVTDLKTETIPEIFVWIALILSIIFGWYFGSFSLRPLVLGGLVGGGLLALLVLISREKWMGAGDIKIGLILGVLVGYPMAVLGVFLSFILGAIVGLVYLGLKTKTMKDSLPFAPFLIISTLLCLTFGKFLVGWYFGSLIF